MVKVIQRRRARFSNSLRMHRYIHHLTQIIHSEGDIATAKWECIPFSETESDILVTYEKRLKHGDYGRNNGLIWVRNG